MRRRSPRPKRCRPDGELHGGDWRAVDHRLGTAATYQTILQGILYNNTSDTPNPANRAVTVVVNDGALNSTSTTVTVGVTAVNDAPAFAGLDNAPTFTEGGSVVVLDSNALLSDIELDAFNNYSGATLTLARNGGANAQDVFGVSGIVTFSGANIQVSGTTVGTFTNTGGTFAITFNASATSARVDLVLQAITYSNNSDNPPASAQINYTFSDGNAGPQGSGGAGIANGSVTVAITPNNDAPAAVTDTIVVSDSTNVVIPVSALLANDFDLDGGTLSITNVTGLTGISGTIPVTLNLDGTITFTMPGLAADDTSGNSFSYTLSDGQGGTTTGTVNVSVLNVGNATPDNFTFPTGYQYAYLNTGDNNDVINVASGGLTGPAFINGGNGTDAIGLSTTGDGRTLDLTGATITGVENLASFHQGSSDGYDQTITITATQWDGFTTIDMNDGTDTLNVRVVGSMNISTGGVTTLSDTENGHLLGTANNDTIILSGEQLDAILIGGSSSINLGDGTDTIQLTTASIDLTTLGGNDTRIQGVETITAAGAAGSVKINVRSQTEDFTLIGGNAGDQLIGGLGDDTLTGNGGNDQFRLRSGPGTDTITDYTDGQDDLYFLTSSTTFETEASFADIDNNDDNKVIRITETGLTTAEIQAGDAGDDAVNAYVIVYNDEENCGEVWFDTDWNDTANRTLIAILANLDDQADVDAIDATDIGFYTNVADPLILDLGAPGIDLSGLDDGVQFDINADGLPDQMAWTVGEDGILALDVDGNGTIDNGTEIFSPYFAGGEYAAQPGGARVARRKRRRPDRHRRRRLRQPEGLAGPRPRRRQRRRRADRPCGARHHRDQSRRHAGRRLPQRPAASVRGHVQLRRRLDRQLR